MAEECAHLDQISDLSATSDGCEECLQISDDWVHLRKCLSCGHIGCCDQSKNKHATKHFGAKSHPLIQSAEPDEDWIYCYIDDLFMAPA